MHYDFEKDLQDGEWGEKRIATYLKSKDFNILDFNKNNKYDILVEKYGRKKKIEIKTDYKDKTGNICIEFESRGKPSGVSVSESDYYFNYFPNINELWMIKTYELKNLIEDLKIRYALNDLKYGVINVVYGGDNNSSKLYLIDRNYIRNSFHIVSLR